MDKSFRSSALQQSPEFSFTILLQFTNTFLLKIPHCVQQENLPPDILKLNIGRFICFKAKFIPCSPYGYQKILTGHGDWRNKVTFSSSSMSCKKSLLINPEIFPEVGRFPRWGEDWNNSQRTWEGKMRADSEYFCIWVFKEQFYRLIRDSIQDLPSRYQTTSEMSTTEGTAAHKGIFNKKKFKTQITAWKIIVNT